MRKPIVTIAIAFVVVAPCTALAQSPSLTFQKIEHEYTKQKPDGSTAAAPRDAASGVATGRRIHKPVRIITPVGSASPALTTNNKPLTPTVNPALQRNNLEKGGASSPTRPPYDLKANKGG
jgi:type VI protein secretion system component Hcp